jgi:hypothetical protein
LPGSIDADSIAKCEKPRQVPEINDAAAAPLGSIIDAADLAESDRLPGVVDAEGHAECGGWQTPQFDDLAAATGWRK